MDIEKPVEEQKLYTAIGENLINMARNIISIYSQNDEKLRETLKRFDVLVATGNSEELRNIFAELNKSDKISDDVKDVFAILLKVLPM